jgi:hypothetical protein
MSRVLDVNLTVSTPMRRATTTARAEDSVWTCPTTPGELLKASAISMRKRVITSYVGQIAKLAMNRVIVVSNPG